MRKKLEWIIEGKRHTVTEKQGNRKPQDMKTRHEERNPDSQIDAHPGNRAAWRWNCG